MRSLLPLRSPLQALLLAALLLLPASLASAATYTYDQGQQVSLGFSSLPSAFQVYWFSDKDGYLQSGNPLRTTKLTVGTHQITYLLYRVSTQTLAQRGSVDVEVRARAGTGTTTGTSTGTSTGATTQVAPGEFEPVTTLLLGTNDAYSVDDLYPAFLDAVRGEAKTRIYVDSAYVEYELEDIFAQEGVDDADYVYVRTPVDTIWMRDYGPLFVKNQGKLEVRDLDYYPGRDNDDAIPAKVARDLGLTNRRVALYWEGGNFTSDGRGSIFTTTRVFDANSQANSTISSTIGSAFYGKHEAYDEMLNDGGTGHIDMFLLLAGPRTAFVNRFPSGHQNAARMDRHADRLRSAGFAVTRLDLADRSFSSYSNGLIVNKTALVPTYGKASTDNAALAAYRAAGYRAVGIDCRRIIQWSGAIHCITITVPQ